MDIEDDRVEQQLAKLLSDREVDEAVTNAAIMGALKSIPVFGQILDGIAGTLEARSEVERRDALCGVLRHLLVHVEEHQGVIDELKVQAHDHGTMDIEVHDDTAAVLRHMAANIDPKGIGYDLFRGTDFVKALGLDPQQVSDAVEEAEKHALVDVRRAPSAPFSFRYVYPTYMLSRILSDTFAEPFEPDDDRRAVLLAVVDGDFVRGDEIVEATGIPPYRINFAVDWLEDNGLLQVAGGAGTAPYKFHFVRPTFEARREAEKLTTE